MNSVIFTNYFDNGDGLLTTDYKTEDDADFHLHQAVQAASHFSQNLAIPLAQPKTKTKLPD